jgi:hypothetical protein
VKNEGDSFSSEDEKIQISNTYDMTTSLTVRKRSYKFMNIIEENNEDFNIKAKVLNQ